MNHAGDDVLARAALTLNENRHICRRHFVHARSQPLHDFAIPEDDRLRGNLANRLDQ
jgi:hypothetical protein